ncbi:MAG TPA: terminase large subunit [Anaerolineae bacterium]|jgi:phage terminase large subunit-like protein|nr:terminase large subunit [Anaerolineae bacterium]
MRLHPATKYALDAVEQKITTGRWERLACLRHLYDLARGGQLPRVIARRVELATSLPVPARDKDWPWIFDEEQASFVAIDWFRHLVHVEGALAGQPIELIPAHVFDLSMIFGWVSRNDTITRTNGRVVGLRRFEKAFVTEGRKNAKTTRGAGIGLYMMVGDMEEGPAVYCTAVDRTQARVLYKYGKVMAEKSPDIRRRLYIGLYEMRHLQRGGEMKAFSGEVKNKDSFNPSCAFIDEYHAHPTSKLYDLMASAFGQRSQPLLFTITTAGDDVESPCHSEYEYGKMIIDGSISDDPDTTKNERYFVIIREMDDDDDVHDSRNWVKANPLRGATPKGIERLRQQHDEAFGSQDAGKIRIFTVKNLNRWVHGNENSYMGRYMVGEGAKPSRWQQLAVSRAKFLALTRNALCLVGVDLSKKIDLTALAYIFILRDGRIAISAHGFIPDAAVTMHERTDKIPYRDWAKGGWLTITSGDVTDYTRLQEQIQLLDGSITFKEINPDMAKARKIANHYAIGNGWKIHQICYDPYNATHFKNQMDDLGYTTIEVRQTMAALNEPTKFFRDRVAEKSLIHDGSPLLTWCVGNAQEIGDTKENIMLSKKKAKDTRRIDLLAAGIDALYQVESLRAEVSYADYVDSDDFGF